MQLSGKPIRVKLKVDLTRYDNRCKVDSLGYTIPDLKLSIWGSQDRFVAVRFDSGAQLDVLWSGLKIVDKKHLKEMQELKKKEEENLRSARNVKKVIGPKGGFRYLSYEYTNDTGINVHVSEGFKDSAERLIKLFKKYKIPIKAEKEK